MARGVCRCRRKPFPASRTSSTASATFALASGVLTQLASFSVSSLSSGTSTVIAPLAVSIRALPASAVTCDLRHCRVNFRWRYLHRLGLHAQRQCSLRNGNDDSLRLGGGEAVAFQRLAQFAKTSGMNPKRKKRRRNSSRDAVWPWRWAGARMRPTICSIAVAERVSFKLHST